MKIPKAIEDLINSFEKLPGIGHKSAQRLTFYLLHTPQGNLESFADALKNLKNKTIFCGRCMMIDETDPCSICSDLNRDNSIICVVEEPVDVLALEKGGIYKGLYHILHGKIDPLNNIGPDEIYLNQLFDRLKLENNVKEIILATNPTMEGEATAMYIGKQLRNRDSSLRITRIGRGLPIGADIEYADDMTLKNAMEGRMQV